MDVFEAIRQRRSVRAFTTEPVDEATLRQLVDAAIAAPSAVNEQSWLFTVVRDQALLARISTAAKAHVLKAPPANLSAHHLQDLLGNPDFHIFYHAPALVVISSARGGPWAVENCALAAENLMLAAAARGLGTCWIGFAQAWLGTVEGKAAIDLPEAALPVAPIIVGHPRAAAVPVPRREPEISWIG